MEHFTIKDLFQDIRLFNSKQPFLGLSGNKNLSLNQKIIREIEQRTGLQYQNVDDSGEVCFAHINTELRNEYKLIFNKQDILDYACMQINSQNTDINTDISEILLPYPNSADEFWER